MEIKIIKVGPLETNCYILVKNNKCLVIDPGADLNYIVSTIKDNELIGIIVTHYHFDHIGALEELKDKYKVVVYDNSNLIEGINTIDCFDFEVIYTPGHSSDLISIYFKKEKAMFVGDFIFKENIGRCDLDTGNYDIMLKSIENIKKYDDNITIYPGHGETTTLAYEKENNPYFNRRLF